MARDPELLAHIEWLGYLQPVGLVVSPPALADAQAFPSKNIIPDHNRFLEIVDQITLEGENDPQPSIRDFPRFATQILGWEPADLVGTAEGGPVPDSLEVTLTEYNETLRPSYAVPEFSSNQQPELATLRHGSCSSSGSSSASTSMTRQRPMARTTAGRPAPRLALSGSCARPRSRSACSRTGRICGWSTPRGARLRGT